MPDPADEFPCPRCGEPIPATVTTGEPGDQLALDRIHCPSCDAPLVRAVEGHADQGWRVDESAPPA